VTRVQIDADLLELPLMPAEAFEVMELRRERRVLEKRMEKMLASYDKRVAPLRKRSDEIAERVLEIMGAAAHEEETA